MSHEPESHNGTGREPETDATEATEPTAAESSVELESRPHVDRLRKGVVLVAGLVGLIVLTLILLSKTGLHRTEAKPERPTFEVPRLTAERLEQMRLREPSGRPQPPDELTGIFERGRQPLLPPPRPSAQRGARPPQSPSSPSLRVELRRHPEAGTAAERSPAEVPVSVERRAAEATSELLRLTQPAPSEVRDPRQLPRPTETAVRVALAPPLSPYEIKQGTYIPALLAQSASSGLGGMLRALVSTDIRDAATRSHVLIPRGTVVLGHQERQPLTGERRLLVTWQRLVYPDGQSLTLGSEPAAGRDGSLGLPGKVNRHWRQKIGTAALLSLVGAGFQLSQPQRNGDRGTPTSGEIAAGAVGLELGRLSQETLRQLIDLPPTVTLQPGAPVHILVTRDLAFERPWLPKP